MTVFPCERVGSGDRTKLEVATTLIQPVPFLVIMKPYNCLTQLYLHAYMRLPNRLLYLRMKLEVEKAVGNVCERNCFKGKKIYITIICVLLFLAHCL